jgi:hypothetical protein
MRLAASLSIGLAVVLLVGCTSVPAGSKPRLSKDKATQIATALARHEGAELEHFIAPRVSYDSAERRWLILFDQKPPAVVDGDIFIEVDDATGVGTLIPSG